MLLSDCPPVGLIAIAPAGGVTVAVTGILAPAHELLFVNST